MWPWSKHKIDEVSDAYAVLGKLGKFPAEKQLSITQRRGIINKAMRETGMSPDEILEAMNRRH